MNPPPTIESVAAKFKAVQNFDAEDFAAALRKEPRWAELARFVPWRFRQPGGLEKFSRDFVTQFSGAIGTSAMRRIGKTSEPYTAAERQEVIASFNNGIGEHGWVCGDVKVGSILYNFEREMVGQSDLEGSVKTPRYGLRQ
jgi:hypothetical protein